MYSVSWDRVKVLLVKFIYVISFYRSYIYTNVENDSIILSRFISTFYNRKNMVLLFLSRPLIVVGEPGKTYQKNLLKNKNTSKIHTTAHPFIFSSIKNWNKNRVFQCNAFVF